MEFSPLQVRKLKRAVLRYQNGTNKPFKIDQENSFQITRGTNRKCDECFFLVHFTENDRRIRKVEFSDMNTETVIKLAEVLINMRKIEEVHSI